MLPGELRCKLWLQVVGKALKGAKNLFLAFVNASETDEFLPKHAKPSTFENLVAAILLFVISRWKSRARTCIADLYTSFLIGWSKSNQSKLPNYHSYFPGRNACELLYKMAAFRSTVRLLTRRGIFQASRAFSLGSSSRTSVAVVSIIYNWFSKTIFARNCIPTITTKCCGLNSFLGWIFPNLFDACCPLCDIHYLNLVRNKTKNQSGLEIFQGLTNFRHQQYWVLTFQWSRVGGQEGFFRGGIHM